MIHLQSERQFHTIRAILCCLVIQIFKTFLHFPFLHKNKNGNMTDIKLHTVVWELLEHFILSNISPFLGTTDNQFGLKAGHGTDHYTFLLKQTASYFVTYVSSVHAIFWMFRKHSNKYHTKIIWNTNSAECAKLFYAATETLVQWTNYENETGQALADMFHVTYGVKHSSLGPHKGFFSLGIATINGFLSGFPHNFQNRIPWHSMTFPWLSHDICYTFSMRV